jgi:hypothetical protein
MTPFEEQFEILHRSEPNSSYKKLADGTYLIIVSGISLPDGWSKKTVGVISLLRGRHASR